MQRPCLSLICLLLLLPVSLPTWAETAVPGPRWSAPNWTEHEALQAAGEVDLVTELGPLFERARAGEDVDLRRRLEAVAANEKWPLPARERLLHAFALGLGDLPPGAAGPESLAYLLDYRPQTLVPHEDHASAGIPLFNVPAAATGSMNLWRRQTAYDASRQFLAGGAEAWVAAYSAAGPASRRGFIDALDRASGEQLRAVAALALRDMGQRPELTGVAARSAALLPDPDLLGDADLETAYGFPEHAMLTNGGIHAREWQSPEVATGIIELLALGDDDRHLLAYLRENANVLVIPVLNVDGFLQTQRYPDRNGLGTDPDDPEYSPRDGRMRRKNMRGADESLATRGDHLQGIDLNRNNPPYWATSLSRSSFDPASLVHHGASPHSEPEMQALEAAAQLGPAGKLSLYTDLHSFSQVHLWVRSNNSRLATLTESLLRTFTQFHRRFPANKYYPFASAVNAPRNKGIGATDEFFTHNYQVPAWTLEIEPTNGGVDYGGFGRNGHDGFILPESQIERVRTELAQTFAVAYYRQAGPPSITALHVTDAATGAVVVAAEWDTAGPTQRELHTFQAQPLQLGRDYRVWLAWDKPMRWRTNGAVSVLPGQPQLTLGVQRGLTVGGDDLNLTLGEPGWLDLPGGSPAGYRRYRDDAMAYDLNLPADVDNASRVQGTVQATLHTDVYDFTGNRGDANPATVARWDQGAWSGYEDSDGLDQNDRGGSDSTLRVEVTAENLGAPFVVEPGTSSAWFDTDRNGEGFVLEVLAGGHAVMYWFTYDGEGRQDWYVAVGEIRGNRALFPELLRVTGGEFGPGFDPDKVERTVIGSASFIWSSCDSGAMSWTIDGDGGPRRAGRMNLARLTRVMGLDCGMQIGAPEVPAGRLSGSWYDPSHSGEGYVLEVLAGQQALVYWFSFDGQGQRRWFFGTGEIQGDTLSFEEMLTTSGGVFGADFDPATVAVEPWGSLELELTCASGTANFAPTEPGFPAGALALVRLSTLDGLHCGE